MIKSKNEKDAMRFKIDKFKTGYVANIKVLLQIIIILGQKLR